MSAASNAPISLDYTQTTPLTSQVTFLATGWKRSVTGRDNTATLYWPTSLVLFKPAIIQNPSVVPASNTPRIMVATAMTDPDRLSILESFVNDSLLDMQRNYIPSRDSTENLMERIREKWPAELEDSGIRVSLAADSQAAEMATWLAAAEGAVVMH